ncbi:rhodanese-like domain-containing protein, partial [Bacillus thuringiensis]
FPLIQSGTHPVIDVRNQSEWNEGHLPHAKHITLEHLTKHVQDIPKDRPIIVQCRSGIRSAIASKYITETWCKGSNECTRWISSMAKGGIHYL